MRSGAAAGPPADRAGVSIGPLIGAFAPKLLHGLRVWVAVCLALYMAFALELDDPYWAGLSALLVCQPSLGASLRRSSARLIGTVAGATFAVLLGALFPQDRMGFLMGLALWGGACAFVATVLRDYAAYAAGLAGYTTAIICGSALGPTGGIGPEIFTIAVLRASEISLGIVSASIVIAATSIGRDRRNLMAELCRLATDIGNGLADACCKTGQAQADARPRRHALLSRIVAASALIEDAIGEDYDLAHKRPMLRAATAGLVAAISGWRIVANCLEQMSTVEGAEEGAFVYRILPAALRTDDKILDQRVWCDRIPLLRSAVSQAAHTLIRYPADTPSLRLIADGAAEALLGLAQTLDGIAWLDDPSTPGATRRGAGRFVPDLLPASLSAVRATAAVGTAALLWIATAWPNGGTALSFAALCVIFFSPRGDRAYAAARDYAFGGAVGIVLALVLEFGVLPACTTFEMLAATLAFIFVPIGTLAMVPSVAPFSNAAAILFIRVLAPENQMSYDAASTWNFALAIVVGLIIAIGAIALFPPPAPAILARRAASAALRDLRRLILRNKGIGLVQWEDRNYRRLASLSPGVDPILLARSVAALSLGTEILRLRRLSGQHDFRAQLDQALQSLATGRREEAVEQLSRLGRHLAEASDGTSELLRALGNIRSVCATLVRHADYFDQMDLA